MILERSVASFSFLRMYLSRAGKNAHPAPIASELVAKRDFRATPTSGTRVLVRFFALVSLVMAASGLAAQVSVEVPANTPLPVQLGKHVPMKKGEILQCNLIYPVYAENQLAIPAGSVLRGRVVSLDPDRSRRIHGRLWGDFTPFHIAVVHFDQLVLPDGTIKQIVSSDASNGAPVLHLSAPDPGPPRSFIAQQIAQAKKSAKDTIALVTAPGRGDRLVQLVYRQLPYHPERIETATMWTVTLTRPLALQSIEVSANVKKLAIDPTSAKPPLTPSPQAKMASDEKSAWHLHAYLEETISSDKEKPGNTFDAVIAEPVFNPDHTVAVPEGSVLVGTITQAKPAKFFGRAGKLRFDFRELRLPGAPSEHVQGALTGADASRSQQLQIDSEGGVKSQPQNRVIVPLVLTLLAGRALDEDGSVSGNAAVASNSFGVIGRVVGIVAGSRGLAAGLGYYAAGLSFAERWLVHGQNVAFVKNTRIEVTTVPGRSPLPADEPNQISSEKH